MGHKYSFTLIELLVVIAIFVILVALLLPALSLAKEKGRQITCVNNLKQIGAAFLLYQDDWNGWYPLPWAAGPGVWIQQLWDQNYFSTSMSYNTARYLVPPFTKTIMRCPSADDSVSFSYGQNRLAETQGNAFNKNAKLAVAPEKTCLVADSTQATVGGDPPITGANEYLTGRHSNGANILYYDGHVDWRIPYTLPRTYSDRFWDSY